MFDIKKFKESLNTWETLSFFGVNTHHKNGKAENRIKDVTTGARTALLHAYHLWPNATHASLWTADINIYFNLIKSIPANLKPKNYHGRNKISTTYDYSTLSIFSGSKVETNSDNFHPFGSPVYILGNSLQSGKYHNK